MEYKIKQLQESLSALRRLAGWTVNDMADKLGVSRQTIFNLEHNETEMTQIQYIAIRAILEAEVSEHPEKETLAAAIAILLDSEGDLNEDQMEEVKKSIETVAKTASSGADQSTLIQLLKLLVPVALPIISLVLDVTMGTGKTPMWLSNILKSKK